MLTLLKAIFFLNYPCLLLRALKAFIPLTQCRLCVSIKADLSESDSVPGWISEKSMIFQNINLPPTVHETSPNEVLHEMSNNLLPIGRLPYFPRGL